MRSSSFSLLLLAQTITVFSRGPEVQLQYGTLRGTTCDGSRVSRYQKIPFAEPPVGPLRFMPPVPLNKAYPGGVLNATDPSPTCIQMSPQFAWSEPSSSEDCLYLDVYVPLGITNTSNLPVKFWVHGGGNTGGSTSYPLYDMCNVATDVIAVSINYRLGPLGFFGLDDAGIEGNMGLKDYFTALKWVHENIASFGGDPGKILAYGQSSGADDTYVLSTLPQAKPYMAAAICESGGGVDLPPYEDVQEFGATFAGLLECASHNLTCLQSRPVGDIVKAFTHFPHHDTGDFKNPALGAWQVGRPNSTLVPLPFVDGNFITEQPLKRGSQVPIMLGTASQDGSLFSLPTFELGPTVSEKNYTTYISQFGSLAPKVAKQYPLSLFNSSGSTETAVVEAVTHIETTAAFICFTYRGLRSAQKSNVPVYAYRFNHTPSCPWVWSEGEPIPPPKDLGLFGPTHTSEIPFVLGNVNNLPWGNGTCDFTASEKQLSKAMEKSWTAMAETSNPSIKGLEWPRFNECSNAGVQINEKMEPGKLDFSECQFWDEIWAEMGGIKIDPPTCS